LNNLLSEITESIEDVTPPMNKISSSEEKIKMVLRNPGMLDGMIIRKNEPILKF